MFVFFRALVYATLFIGLLLIYLPSQILRWAGISQPASFDWPQIVAWIVGSIGALIALSCVAAFIVIGEGTPAPFDPPRRLVIRGPYRFVRNPMYLGAALALASAALYYQSTALLLFVCGFLLVTHLFVTLYEEPTLKRTFGPDYEIYCHIVHRWWPRLRGER